MNQHADQADTVVIDSEVYGRIVIEPNHIYRFGAGIVGVPSIHEYVLIPIEDSPFFILHALDEQISFIVIEAHQAVDNYNFAISDEVADLLAVRQADDMAVMLIVNIQEEQLFLNLKAPVLLAPHSQQGCQYIIHDQELPIRHLLQRKEE
ncbi:flagellar assembly protein FliW [Paenibacillus bouchesdurhonensis]|uniref:flagellar assembly protein FliW n=1 Tax=Paenibacillus bouchesdurhonensis TaxID=1870990 RepID=UPI000DA60670|nr:flagellar assembly protein FliW [Paenibacillus bouchesdurhonensis]